tara:strand:- start:1455 stop:3830 length:2376 start_codon:yes stop_codon:yes gene_type:complete
MAAIKFLNSINLVGSQLQNFLVQPVATAPTVYGVGQLYYDTSTNKLRLRDNTGWVDIDTGTDGDTTYDLTVEQNSGSNSNPILTLTGNDGSVDPVTITGSGGVTVTRTSATAFTIDGTDGDITAVTASTSNVLKGISVASGSGPIPVIGLDIQGQTQLSGTPDDTDRLLIFDGSTPQNKYITVSDLMSAGGDITAIVAGNGLTGTSLSGPIPTLNVGVGSGISVTADAVGVDYVGSDNVVLSAADGTGLGTLTTSDKVMVSDASDDNAYYVNISQLPTSGGTVTSVAVTDGYLIDSSVANPTGAANITLDVDASELVDMTGGMVTTDEFFVLDVSETGKDQGKRKAAGEIGLSIFNNDAGFITSSSVITYTLPVSAGGANTAVITLDASSGTDSTVTFQGTSNEIQITEVTGNNGNIVIGLPDDVTITGDLTVNGGDINLTNSATDIDLIDNNTSALSFDSTGSAGILEIVTTNGDEHVKFSGYLDVNGDNGAANPLSATFAENISIPLTPVSTTDAASKNYVDTQLAGSGVLIFQGGYNAATNTPDLDSSPSASIKKGWSYVVTNDGSFFTEQVRAGDFLIANSDSPTALSDWTTVQSNIDLASTTTPGIASFSSDNFAVSAAGQVTVKNNGIILGTETTGNYVATVQASTSNDEIGAIISGSGSESADVKVGIDIKGTTNLGAAPDEADELLIYDTSGDVNKAVTVTNLASVIHGNNGATATGPSTAASTMSVIHGLGTDVIVQVFEISSGNTVFCDVQRTTASSGTVTLNFSSSQTANTLRVLISKVS